MGDTIADRAIWIKSVLGMPIPLDAMGGARVGGPPVDIAPPKKKGFLARFIPGDGTLAGQPVAPVPPPEKFVSGLRTVSIQKSPSGVVYTAPRPPVKSIVISGGGGKGVALVGMLQALEDNHVTEGLTQVRGASVGAMTSAMIAAGMTAKEVKELADDKEVIKRMTDGTGGGKIALLAQAIKNWGSPLTGEGLKDVVKAGMDSSLTLRVQEYQEEYQKDHGGAEDANLTAIMASIGPDGPTFMHLRQLSKIMPDKIKELSITGTMMKDMPGGGGGTPDTHGELVVFDADTYPNVPVALAVQASAAFPLAFKSVDIDLAQGTGGPPRMAKFIDGGVLNNTPTETSIGGDLSLDPIPDKRSMNFVFEGSGSADVLKGKAPAPPGGIGAKIIDKLVTGSDNSSAEYILSRDALAHAEDFIPVPLKGFFWKDGRLLPDYVDMTGTVFGTLNFQPSADRVEEIRSRTQKATAAHIFKMNTTPKSYKFATEGQMLMGIPLEDLKMLADGRYDGAAAAYKFRQDADAAVAALGAVRGDPGVDLKTSFVQLDSLARGDADRVAYIGKAIHKANLQDLAGSGAAKMPGDVAKAVAAVSEAKQAHAFADKVFKDHVGPKMKFEEPGGRSIALLVSSADALGKAVSYGEIKETLETLERFYANKSDVYEDSAVIKEMESLLPKATHALQFTKAKHHEEFHAQVVADLSTLKGMMDRA